MTYGNSNEGLDDWHRKHTHTLLSQDTRMKQIFSVNHSFSTVWVCVSKSDIFSTKGADQVLTSDNYENFASTKTMLWKKKRICDFFALAMKFIMTFQQHFCRKITSHHTCTSTQPGSSRTKGATLSPISSEKVYWCLSIFCPKGPMHENDSETVSGNHF